MLQRSSSGFQNVLMSLAFAFLGSMLLGCATVRPEQRAVLADPIMQFEDQASEEQAREHVFENREASFGGGAVRGGGCGCN